MRGRRACKQETDHAIFEIKQNDIEGIVINAHRGMTVKGRVVIEGPPLADALAKRSQLKLKVSTLVSNQNLVYVNREVAVNADGTFKVVGLPHGPVAISATFCDVCEFFAMERVEYTKADATDDIQLAKEGIFPESRVFNVDDTLQAVRIALRYKAASISCHVNVIGTLPPQVRLMVLVSSRTGNTGWSGWRKIDANGNLLETGLDPGDYELEIGDGSRKFTKPKRVTVKKNQQTKISFTVDANRIHERD